MKLFCMFLLLAVLGGGRVDTSRGFPVLQLQVTNTGKSSYQMELVPGTCFTPEDGSSNAAYLIAPLTLNVPPGQTQKVEAPVLLQGETRPGPWSSGGRTSSKLRVRLLQRAWESRSPAWGWVEQSAVCHLAWFGRENGGAVDSKVLQKVSSLSGQSGLERLVPFAQKLLGDEVARLAQADERVSAGETQLAAGRPAGALAAAEEAIRLDDGLLTRARFTRARALYALGRWEEAARDFSRCIQTLPPDPEFYYGRAMCRMQLDDREGARLELDALLRRWPAHTRAAATRATWNQAPTATRPAPLSGRWSGTWTNSVGETGPDSLELTEDAQGRLQAVWTGYVRLEGQRVDAATLRLRGRTEKREFDVVGKLEGETLHLQYVARRLDGPGSYEGSSRLTRARP